MQPPFLEAAVGTPPTLQSQLSVDGDVLVCGVVDEISIRNQNTHVALAAAMRQGIGHADPVVSAGIEIVDEVVGVGAREARAGVKLGRLPASSWIYRSAFREMNDLVAPVA